jgi:hypothetical protein
VVRETEGMISINILTNADQTPPLQGKDPAKCVHIKEGVTIARMPRGMASGASSVSITCNLPDGKHLLLEMSLALFEGAAAAFRGAEQRDKENPTRN